MSPIHRSKLWIAVACQWPALDLHWALRVSPFNAMSLQVSWYEPGGIPPCAALAVNGCQAIISSATTPSASRERMSFLLLGKVPRAPGVRLSLWYVTSAGNGTRLKMGCFASATIPGGASQPLHQSADS